MSTYNKTLNKPIHPGVTLKEVLEEIQMSQSELAKRTLLKPQTISDITRGQNPVTPETSIKLERVLGIPQSFWNNLQSNYEASLANLQANAQIEDSIEESKKYNKAYSTISSLGWIEATTDQVKKAHNLLAFFGVHQFNVIPDFYAYTTFRRYGNSNISEESMACWLRKGEIDGENISTEIYSASELRKALTAIRSLSLLKPSEYGKELVKVFRELGIALVFTEYLPNTKVTGAMRWLHPEKPLIQLSLMYKREDIFWFSLFHELGHLLKHSKKNSYVDFRSNGEKTSIEKEADNFAKTTLIPEAKYQQFKSENIEYPKRVVEEFAKEIQISPSIVAGRLGFEKEISQRQALSMITRVQLGPSV